MRDGMQHMFLALGPLVYGCVTLAALTTCILCVRRLCCEGRDGEGGDRPAGHSRVPGETHPRMCTGYVEGRGHAAGGGGRREKRRRRGRSRQEHTLVAATSDGEEADVEPATPMADTEEGGGGAGGS
jgi:hypothetical protein